MTHTQTLEMLSREEAEQLIEFYMWMAVSYSFGVLSDGTPAFMLKSGGAVIVDEDGSVSWTVREIGVGLHSFIELTTGQKTRRKITIPLCLVNPKARQSLKPLLASTISPSDGRLNSKPAEAYILTPEGAGFKVHFKLQNLTTQYAMLQLFPSDFAARFKSKHCPFCREKSEEHGGR